MKVWKIEDREKPQGIEQLVETFTASEDVVWDKKLIPYDILGSIAHVMGLKDIGIISKQEADKLKSALVDLLTTEIELTPEDEDVHSKVENLLIQRLGKLGEKIHTGRSRNDQILLDTRLYIKDNLFSLTCKLLELAQSLLDLASQNEKVPMPGYSHMRKAMPSSVGLWASSFVESILDDIVVLETGFSLCDQSPLGAGAGYGVPINLNRNLTADLLGFSRVQNNTLYVMNSRGKFEFILLAGLGNINIDLSRLSADLILFSCEDIGYFTLPDEFTTGSSIMPQKSNPDILELIRGKSSRLLGNICSVYSVLPALTSGYHRDLQEVKEPLMKSFETTKSSTNILSALIRGLEVNQNRLKASFNKQMMATDKVFEGVKKGKPFRSAYQQVKKDLQFEDKGSPTRAEIDRALRSRRHPGGPGNLGLKKLADGIEENKSKWAKREKDFHQKLDQLTMTARG